MKTLKNPFVLAAGGIVAACLLVSPISEVIGQTINPVNAQSGQTPVPVGPLLPGFQPLKPTRQNARPANEGLAVLDESVEPVEEADAPNLSDALSMTEQTRVGESNPSTLSTSPGKGVAEETGDKLWRLRPIVGFGVVFDDNIFLTQTNMVSDVVFTFTAGLAFEIGDYRRLQDNYLLAEYIATGFVYVDNPQQDAVDQAASLIGQYRFNRLAVQLESRYQYLNGAEREVGSFVTRNIITNALRGIYELSEKTELDLELFQRANIYETQLDNYVYGVKFGGNYELTDKIAVGGESVFGVSLTDESPTQYYAQLRARAAYNATGKLTFKSSFGIEFRMLEDGLRLNPVFNARAEYRPWENTLVTLGGYGNVQSSASVADASFLATGVEFSVRQLLFQRVTAGFALGYENDTYYSNTNGDQESRVDNYIFFRPNLSYNFNRWVSAGVFYEFRRNSSTEDGSSFYNNRVGFEAGARF
jgi:hypothetical protein